MSWKAIPFYIYGANVMIPLSGGIPVLPYLSCLHFWSLALEEQFYSLWPLVVFLVWRRKPLMQICAGGIVVALLLRIVLTHLRVSPWLLYVELPTRMDSLLSGAMPALVLRGPRPELWRRRSVIYPVMGGCCVVLLALFIRAKTLFFSSSEMTSWGYSMFAGVYVCVLALALIPGTLTNRIGRIPVFRFFGRYSYGLYIWHHLPAPISVPWVSWFIHHIHPLMLAQMAYLLSMSAMFTAVAVVSYHLLEVRFLRLKSIFPYKEGPRYAEQPQLKLRTADEAGPL